jgi:hypothetical protein
MAEEWTQEGIEQEYINAQAEESTTLEYKAADALGKSDGKKKEITRDVSALANAAGGIIIYGIKEYDEENKKHLPESLNPIDRTQFPKEWLEQVINNIRPRIDGLVIHPVPVNEDARPNDVVYVVEVPQSTTAHQATDLRYYRRYNFERLPMQDHEIRDVMNRGAKPNAAVEFSWKRVGSAPGGQLYRLGVTVRNQGLLVIEHFKLEFTFPDLDEAPIPVVVMVMPSDFERQPETVQRPESKLTEVEGRDNIYVSVKRGGGLICASYRSRDVLFPNDKRVVDEDIALKYTVNKQVYFGRHDIPSLRWTLYADSMLPKHGEISFSQLCGLY